MYVGLFDFLYEIQFTEEIKCIWFDLPVIFQVNLEHWSSIPGKTKVSKSAGLLHTSEGKPCRHASFCNVRDGFQGFNYDACLAHGRFERRRFFSVQHSGLSTTWAWTSRRRGRRTWPRGTRGLLHWKYEQLLCKQIKSLWTRNISQILFFFLNVTTVILFSLTVDHKVIVLSSVLRLCEEVALSECGHHRRQRQEMVESP